MSLVPQWMAAVAQPFSQWIQSWMVQDYSAFQELSPMVSAQSWATIRGTMVRGADGRSEPWLQVFTGHLAGGNYMAWPRAVLSLLQQPLCNLPVCAVATMLDVGAMCLYDRRLQRVIPVGTGQQSMSVLMASKQSARIQGDVVPGHITEGLLSLSKGDDNVATNAGHTLDALSLGAVVGGRSGGQCMVTASAWGPGLSWVAVIGEMLHHHG